MSTIIFGYPVNHVLESAACAGIRPIIVRQERVGLHMADALSRLTSGRKIGVFAMQHGPGSENSFGGVAQAYSESVPILVLPMGYARRRAQVDPNFNSVASMRSVTKSAEAITSPAEIPNVFRRAFSNLRNGRGGPALVEIPLDLFAEDVPEPFIYEPVVSTRYCPDPADVRRAAAALVEAKNLVVYAGQGIHYARAWESLKELAELLDAPVATSLQGKSAFPEDHPLALGAGGNAFPPMVPHFLEKADLIFGIGCSFTETTFGIAMPRGKRFIHATLDPKHLNKDIRADIGLIGDARLTLDALLVEIKHLIEKPRRSLGYRRDCNDPQKLAQRMDAETNLRCSSSVSLSCDLGLAAYGGCCKYHHHARCGQSARSTSSILDHKEAVHLHRLGQNHAAGIRPRPCHGRKARLPGKTLRECLGRCRHRLYGHGFRDCRARADSDSLDPAE